MSEQQSAHDEQKSAEHEAVQAVVDRVSSYQDAAPEGTVEQELRRGLGEVGVELGPDQVSQLVDAIEKRDGDVDAKEVLG